MSEEVTSATESSRGVVRLVTRGAWLKAAALAIVACLGCMVPHVRAQSASVQSALHVPNLAGGRRGGG
jgi:hypothetical protein